MVGLVVKHALFIILYAIFSKETRSFSSYPLVKNRLKCVLPVAIRNTFSNDTVALSSSSAPSPSTPVAVPLALGQRLEEFDPAIIKCPFFRRRATDFLEGAVLCGRWLASRHKSLDLSFGLLPLRQPFVDGIASRDIFNDEEPQQKGLVGSHSFGGRKVLRASRSIVLSVLAEDFAERQCQVTGRLSRQYFSENCEFDGPDPDMPVRGTGKYLDASTNLFNHRASRCDLLAAGYVHRETHRDRKDLRREIQEELGEMLVARTNMRVGNTEKHDGDLVILWRIEGTVNLPWHPTIKPYYGATFFQRSPETGLIVRAREYWSISAVDAFASAVPGIADKFGAAPAPSAANLLRRDSQAASVADDSSVALANEAAAAQSLLAQLLEVPESLAAATRFVPIGSVASTA